jgi:hypothetical protein
MSDILVNGTFKNNTESNTIAYASQIATDASGTKQSDLNSTFAQEIQSLKGGSGGSGSSSDVTGLENRVATLESNSGLSKSYKNYIEGGYFIQGGSFVTGEHYGYQTDYIPIVGGAKYTLVIAGQGKTTSHLSANVITYYSNKTYRDYHACNEASRTVTVKSDAAYMRVSFPLDYIEDVKFVDASDNIIWKPQILETVPYSITEILNKDRLINKKAFGLGSDLRLFFFSDIHDDRGAFERIIQTANNWKKDDLIDAVLNGGDTVKNTLADGYTWYNNLVSTLNVPLLTALGNHDAKQGSSAASESTAYNALMATSLTQLSELIDSSQISHSDTNSYYYVDFNSHINQSTKIIRLIVLNCMTADSYWNENDGAQLNWLNATLDSIKNNSNYYVIILNHASLHEIGTFTDINSNFTDTSNNEEQTWNVQSSALAAVNTFINGGGKFICWLCGHRHMDRFIYPTNYSNQPMFATDCANSSQTVDGKPYWTRDRNDVFKDVFNYITVDLTNNILRIIRIGKNYDKRMISKTCIEYNFSTHQVIRQW